MTALYVYALLERPRGKETIRGVAREPVSVVRAGRVFAAVGSVPEAPPVTESTLRAHDSVVRRLAGRARAILPARFGSVVRDASELRDLISERASELEEALARVRGCEEMTLRVFGRRGSDTSRRKLSRSSPRASGAGTRHMEALLSARRAARSVPELDPLRERLATFVRGERLERHDRGVLLATAHHLVQRGKAASYLRAAREARLLVAPGLKVVASGPAPPYAFAPEALA